MVRLAVYLSLDIDDHSFYYLEQDLSYRLEYAVEELENYHDRDCGISECILFGDEYFQDLCAGYKSINDQYMWIFETSDYFL